MAEESPTRVLIVDDHAMVRNGLSSALEPGAIGYLLKNVGADELASAIRRAREGSRTLAPEAVRVLMHAATHKEEQTDDYGLTGSWARAAGRRRWPWRSSES